MQVMGPMSWLLLLLVIHLGGLHAAKKKVHFYGTLSREQRVAPV
jgi:hypothetical protein